MDIYTVQAFMTKMIILNLQLPLNFRTKNKIETYMAKINFAAFW